MTTPDIETTTPVTPEADATTMLLQRCAVAGAAFAVASEWFSILQRHAEDLTFLLGNGPAHRLGDYTATLTDRIADVTARLGHQADSVPRADALFVGEQWGAWVANTDALIAEQNGLMLEAKVFSERCASLIAVASVKRREAEQLVAMLTGASAGTPPAA